MKERPEALVRVDSISRPMIEEAWIEGLYDFVDTNPSLRNAVALNQPGQIQYQALNAFELRRLAALTPNAYTSLTAGMADRRETTQRKRTVRADKYVTKKDYLSIGLQKDPELIAERHSLLFVLHHRLEIDLPPSPYLTVGLGRFTPEKRGLVLDELAGYELPPQVHLGALAMQITFLD